MSGSLDALLGRERVKRDASTLQAWGRDWTRDQNANPIAVVFPESIEQVVGLVELARAEKMALVPSGGRTGLSGGAVAANAEVVVSFDRMNGILNFNPTDRLVTCQAGVITQVVQQYATDQGLHYPVDFASAGSSQIGGNIATNAGGIKVIRYGLTRDWVAGLRVVTGTGELIDCNRGLVKNATGYDLRHLFIGSEGTLGFIVEADLRLARAPSVQQVMLLGVRHLRDLLAVLTTFQSEVTLSAFEFFSDLALDKVMEHRGVRAPLAERSAFYALLEFDLEDAAGGERAFATAVDAGLVTDGVLSQSEAQAAALWQLREGISESIARFSPYKNDLSVKISELPEFVDAVDALVTRRYPDFDVCWYGHIGDGNLHLNILKSPELSIEDFYARCHSVSREIFELVAERHGSISAEHGVGLLKRDFLEYTRSAEELRLMRGLKGVFDPDGIMNPGKLLS